MEQSLSDESMERIFNPELDQEPTVRLLGSLGLSMGVYDASQDNYVNPPEPMNKWNIN